MWVGGHARRWCPRETIGVSSSVIQGRVIARLPLARHTLKSLVPIPQPQPLNPAEFPLVARNQLGIMGECRTRNQNVQRPDRLAALFQISAYPGGAAAFHDAERYYLDPGQQFLQLGAVAFAVAAPRPCLTL